MNTDIKLSWKLVDLNEDLLNIKITFDDPLAVSQDEEADFALVKIEGFDKFVDANGKSLPKTLVKKIALPAQFSSEEEA